MKTLMYYFASCLFVLVLASITVHCTGSEEDDGFRRLLRRASAEADRPLLRQQRRNRDDDDEDSFELSHESVVRKKREEEDHFYHTLLKRVENKRYEKRSFDTDDVDNKDALGMREDWTGDSKISDADKSELENLFSKLNTNDEEKKDVTRSVEENPVNQAASDYASWLLEQPSGKLSGAINRKLDVDHSLTKLLFEDKRDLSKQEKKHFRKLKQNAEQADRKTDVAKVNNTASAVTPAANKTSEGVLVNTTSPKPEAAPAAPTNSSALNNKTSIEENVKNNPAPLNESSPLVGGTNQRDETSAPILNATTPVNVTTANATNTGASNVAGNTTDPASTCRSFCSPRLVAVDNPCTCQEVANATTSSGNSASGITISGPKLCTDDSPQCLCTRACYPKLIATLSPCSCEGDEKRNQSSANAFPAPATETNATATHGPDVYARSWCQSACHPYSVAFENPCKCAKEVNQDSVVKSFPPRAPALVPSYSNYAAAVQMPAQGYANQQQPYAAAYPYQTQAQAVPSAYNYQVSNYQGVDSNPEVRTSVKSKDGTCQRSCFPHAMLSQSPCLCSNVTVAPVEKGKKSGSSLQDRIYTDSAYYQGCFKDMRPLRDLPKRYTRYRTTPENCVRECAYQNYKFAGVQYGYLCFCGNAFGRYGSLPDNDCNSDCLGDARRKCGGYYHNSIYSVDGKEYDPSDFDFAKIDEEEKKRDALVEAQQPTLYDPSNPAYAGMTNFVNNYPGQPMAGHTERQNQQGDNVATHLVKAAQAALTAAQKLLPSVAKKHKIATKGQKVKREDDEEDSAIMQQKLSALSSLGAVHDILKKTAFISETRDADRDKRSIDEDSDPYDPEDGKELLTAYMANVDLYKRQTRSVDEDEEEDDGNEKPKFEYRRMTIGETDEGEFVEKYNDPSPKKNKKKKRDALDFVTYKHIKRSAEDETGSASQKAIVTPIKTNIKPVEKRSLKESNIVLSSRKLRSLSVGEVVNERSIVEGSGVGNANKHSLSHSRRRRSLMESGEQVNKKKRDTRKAELAMANLPEGAVKMAARSTDVNDIEASLRALEVLAKRDEVLKENDAGDSTDSAESGDSEDSDGESGSGGFEDDESDEEVDKLFEKRSVSDEEAPMSNKLRSDVDKGVDNLLNLVVELYKQQKTIRAFESSVRSLRDDIMGELKVPKNKKQYASKKVRAEIEKTAKQRLHVLTSSIENKIKQFARQHPEASNQVNLASSLLPQLPLTDEKYRIAKREITRRAAEFENLEDSTPKFHQDAVIPDILKEHFRRNAEDSMDDQEYDSRSQRTVNGEVTLPRMHRNVQESQMEVGEEDYDVLFH